MSMRVEPPSLLKCPTYERYKQELQFWRAATKVPADKQGVVVALSLPTDEEDPRNLIRAKVFEQLSQEELQRENGFQTLVTFLDKHLGKDDLTDSLEKFEDFEDFKKESNQSVSEYIDKFDQKYNRLAKLNMPLPPAILAFKLLKRANLTKEEKMLVFTGMRFEDKESLYEDAKTSLRKFLGDQVTGGAGGGSNLSGSIKLEPAFLAEHEEALVAAGYVKRSDWRGNWRGRGRGFSRGAFQRNTYVDGFGVGRSSASDSKKRNVNPSGPDGQPLLCKSCGSYRHLLAQCPDSWENMAQVKLVDTEKEDVVLFTGNDRKHLQQFRQEAGNCAVLDSAASSTVCGEIWLEDYLSSLSDEDKHKVVKSPGDKVYRFGGGEVLKSQGSYCIPAVLAGKEVLIRTDVVSSDIPLLLSKPSMKRAKVKLDLENDTAEISGVTVSLDNTSSGHYCISLVKEDKMRVDSVFAVNLGQLSDNARYQALLKLHRQFAHPPLHKLKALIKDAGAWEDDFARDLETIQERCQVCKQYTKTPCRPAVALPMAHRFNQKVCMDLKKWNGKWILHMIDMYSRLTVSVFIKRKTPQEVLDKVMTHWIGAAFGVMESVLVDNGGEFNSGETREVASILNMEMCTTAAESPFQNGLCERNHAITDLMLLKLVEQCPNTSLDLLLCWANMAKNSLQMWHGYSSYQIVFGKNPNLPNIMTENVPALVGSTSSEILAEHLNALHAARRAFVESEADERIRRALRCKIRASEQIFDRGDRVYYKREGHERWLGPGKVIFQDGRVVFVRHGNIFVRVSPNRLIKAGREFASRLEDSAEAQQGADILQQRRTVDVGTEESPIAEIIGVEAQVSKPTDLSIEEPPIAEIVEVEDEVRKPADLSGNCQVKRGDKIEYKLKENSEWDKATILQRGGKATGQFKDWYNIRKENGEQLSIDLAAVKQWKKYDELEEVNVVTIPRDRHQEADCQKAKDVELAKLSEFDTYEVVKDEGQHRISTTWILWLKGSEMRARLVARGFEDEGVMRKDSPTVGKRVIRLMISIAASKGWPIKTTDIKSAFLQGKIMDRDVYLIPPKEAYLDKGKLWKLKHCLYGLNDAARHFYQSVVEAMTTMNCEQSKLDPALYFYKRDGQLVGMMASHIDDFLHAGGQSFDFEVMEKLRSRFQAGKLEIGAFTYVGFKLQQDPNGILMDQTDYVKDLDTPLLSPQRVSEKQSLLSEKELSVLRSLVGRLNWVVQGTRPDIAFETVELSTKLRKGVVSDLVTAVKVTRKIKGEAALVFFPALGHPTEWKIVVFSDAAHANLSDGVGSMGAHIVLLVGKSGKCCPLSWHAGKIKRVVRSTIAAEALSLQEALEDSLFLRSHIKEMLGEIDVPIDAFVDNRSVVEAVYSTKLVDDKRLRLDLGAIRQAVNDGEINSVRWCPGGAQLANCMTKRGASGLQLLLVLQSGLISEQFNTF